MLESLNVTRTIAIPGHLAWAQISAIGGFERWFPMIAGCHVDGVGVGATRVLTLQDGSEMRDHILAIDQSARRVDYQRTNSPFAADTYTESVEVHDAPGPKSVISWTAEIDVAPEIWERTAAHIGMALCLAIHGLERALSGKQDL